MKNSREQFHGLADDNDETMKNEKQKKGKGEGEDKKEENIEETIADKEKMRRLPDRLKSALENFNKDELWDIREILVRVARPKDFNRLPSFFGFERGDLENLPDQLKQAIEQEDLDEYQRIGRVISHTIRHDQDWNSRMFEKFPKRRPTFEDLMPD